jgi:hypothetical protein
LYHQPNYILDRETCYLFELQLQLNALALTFSRKDRLVEFLLRRREGQRLLLQVLREMVEEMTPLNVLAKVFDSVNAALQHQTLAGSSDKTGRSGTSMEATMGSGQGGASAQRQETYSSPSIGVGQRGGGGIVHSSSSPALSSESQNMWAHRSGSLSPLSSQEAPILPNTDQGFSGVEDKTPSYIPVVVSQLDMYNHIFMPIEDAKHVEVKYFSAVLIEYIRSLNYFLVPVEHYIYKLVIDVLIRNNRFYQLHQFLQYHIISDSPHVACQLLALEKIYPPTYQLALDMLKRLSSKRKVVREQIVEVLLTRQQFIPALRLIRNSKDVSYSVPRFLDAAFTQNDNTLFYSVYKFFEKRGEITGVECAPYVEAFNRLFVNAEPPPKARNLKN